MRIQGLIFIVLITSTSVFSQIKQAKEVNAKMSKGMQRGWKILIPEAESKQTLKSWEKLMKKYDAKTDNVKKSDDYLSESAVIPSIQVREIFVYSQFDETPEGVYMTVFFDLGGAFLNSEMHKDKTSGVQDLLQGFAKDLATEIIEGQIKEEEKIVEKLAKEQEDLEKQKDDYEKDIRESEERIIQRKNDLEANSKAQEAKKKELAEEKEKLEKTKAKKKKI